MVVETVETTRDQDLPGDVRAITWRLERACPALYGRRVIEIDGKDGEPIPVEVRVENLAAALARFQASGPAGDDEVDS